MKFRFISYTPEVTKYLQIGDVFVFDFDDDDMGYIYHEYIVVKIENKDVYCKSLRSSGELSEKTTVVHFCDKDFPTAEVIGYVIPQ